MLILSLFPGIGLLDRAFEEQGFTVVRGPDVLWGGDVRSFHPPPGKFDGVIGGPPCKAFSTWSTMNAHLGRRPALNLIPQFERCVIEADPAWFLMENVPKAPAPKVPRYSIRQYILDNRWVGGEAMRRRAFSFGSLNPNHKLKFNVVALEATRITRCITASDGRRNGRGVGGKKRPHTLTAQQFSFAETCALQGLPEDFLKDAPFTKDGKFTVVGNGVPLFLGRVVAKAVREVLESETEAK